RYAIQAALDVVLIVMTVIGGRVIPMFTANGVRGSTPRRHPVIERLAPACAVALLAVDLVGPPVGLRVVVLVLGALALGARVLLWRPWQTVRAPLVWVLHAGYLWIPVYFTLRAAAELGAIPMPIATHALTAGAIGMLTLGMMTRTARGHSGRPLIADRYETTAYALIGCAALIRVFVPLLVPAVYLDAMIASACLWSAAYAVYAVRYWPVLTRPRLDGKPG
ncbi:MAG: NnrS family protein, partial [Casimicrobiaceae bacterium]